MSPIISIMVSTLSQSAYLKHEVVTVTEHGPQKAKERDV